MQDTRRHYVFSIPYICCTAIIAVVFAFSLIGCSSSSSSENTSSTPTTLTETQNAESTGSSTSNTPSDTSSSTTASSSSTTQASSSATHIDLSDIPAYSGNPVYIVNNNMPFFTHDDLYVRDLESYSPLDSLGRCGVAIACIGTETMPTEERGRIGEVKPTGWQIAKYDFVDGKYLYNRCHLIGFQLAGENANERNLITGTRYMNVDGMLPYENMIARYVEQTGAHVLYRVTPLYDGNNLLASGVLMEARSIEDSGAGINFNVFAYNVQPRVGIDYATGDNWLTGEESTAPSEEQSPAQTYILNTNSKKFHYPECSSVDKMSDKNKKEVYDTRENVMAEGYEPCGRCNP